MSNMKTPLKQEADADPRSKVTQKLIKTVW